MSTCEPPRRPGPPPTPPAAAVTPDAERALALPVSLGDTVRDAGTGRIGRVMGFVGPFVQLRPVGGGREWDARPERLKPVTRSEALSEGVARSNARSRGERL